MHESAEAFLTALALGYGIAAGEQLDAHRKRQQELHPELTITGTYNVLEKLRSGEPLTEKERKVHEIAACGVLRDLHDELDLVREAGYRAAVVTPNRHIPETMHTLHRVGIYSHITPRLFAIKTSRLFEAAQRNRVFWESRARISARRAR